MTRWLWSVAYFLWSFRCFPAHGLFRFRWHIAKHNARWRGVEYWHRYE